MRLFISLFFLWLSALLLTPSVFAWSPLSVDDDPLVRMPGTQPSSLENIVAPGDGGDSNSCINCHWGEPVVASDKGMPGFAWQGSMMAQAARDPIFWATMTVAAQDSIWAVGRPNATDICLRCHFPQGWMEDRSEELNASAMTASDFDGVHCDACHRFYDPFFKTTNDGTREGNDWTGYWDEATGASATAAGVTATLDSTLASSLTYFNGLPFYDLDAPIETTYTENGGGQMYMDLSSLPAENKRGPFSDAIADHTTRYSRYNKSKYFCSTCHDVSNPVLANLGDDPADGLLTEQKSAHSYSHVERTFSEFMSSAYGMQVNTETNAEFQAQGGAGITHAAKCQDCHMPDVLEVTAASGGGVVRPSGSAEHPNSGVPMHDLQGGNMWITRILASLDSSLDGIYDPTNLALLNQGPTALTLDLSQGINPMASSNGEALLAASLRSENQLKRAATIKNLAYDQVTGELDFQVLNNTGHKLLTGYPEGRRIFINIKAYNGNDLTYEVNPYDFAAGTFKGGVSFWSYDGDDGQVSLPDPTPLGTGEVYVDELVYEAATKSDLTGEDHTFHFALATGRYKDNRIPPKGFDLTEAQARLCEPVWHEAKDDPTTPPAGGNLYSVAEYAGGYDDVNMTIATGATNVVVTLYYQGTSREYVEFLRDEINGTGLNRALDGPDNDVGTGHTYAFNNSLNPDDDNAYRVQSDSFFTKLKLWGDTIWQLWYHNHGLDGSGPSIFGIVPFEMAQAETIFRLISPNGGETFTAGRTITVSWSPVADAVNYRLFYFDADGTPHAVASTGSVTSYEWLIPVDSLAEAGKKFRVTAFDASNAKLGVDRSDGTFTILPFTLAITSPNGGETLMSRTPFTVKWNALAGADKYRLHYFDADRTPHRIANVGYVTSYDWTVPANITIETGKLLRVTAFDASNMTIGIDWSDGPFTVVNAPGTLLSPNGGEIYSSAGPAVNVQWVTHPDAISHRLHYFDADGTSHMVADVGNVTNYSWTIPGSVTTEPGKKFRVTGFNGIGTRVSVDRSNGTFEIQ